MYKINVIGTTGTGKTTFGRSLAEKLDYPFIELDVLYWKDNWQETPDDVFLLCIEKTLARPSWVLDGNYSRSLAIKWREADTVIWLNYRFSVVLFRALKRAVTRVITREPLWQTNNVESLKNLLSTDSIIWWTIKNHRSNRQKFHAQCHCPDYAHIRFIELKSPREAQHFLRQISGYKKSTG